MTDLEFSKSINIKPEEFPQFKLAWENLMSEFKIPVQHQSSLLELMQGFFLKLDHHALYIYELNCSIDALNFFMEYEKDSQKWPKANQQGKLMNVLKCASKFLK